MRLLLPILILSTALACRDAAPRRVVVGMDTLLINGPAPFTLPIEAQDRNGYPLKRTAVQIVVSSDSAVLVADGAAKCRTAGDANLDILAGEQRATMLVQCRPIAGFRMPQYHELRVGGPPAPIPLLPADSLGRRVTEWRAGSRVLDTAIASVRNGWIYPKAFGQTWIEVDFGGLKEIVGAMVLELVAEDTIVLARGESRTWPLSAGRFQVTLTSPVGNAWAIPPTLAADGANCALYRSPELTMHCVVERAATIMVRMPDRASATETGVAVRIVRRPEIQMRPRTLRASR